MIYGRDERREKLENSSLPQRERSAAFGWIVEQIRRAKRSEGTDHAVDQNWLHAQAPSAADQGRSRIHKCIELNKTNLNILKGRIVRREMCE